MNHKTGGGGAATTGMIVFIVLDDRRTYDKIRSTVLNRAALRRIADVTRFVRTSDLNVCPGERSLHVLDQEKIRQMCERSLY